MKVSQFEKILLEKAKLLFSDGFKKDRHFITLRYDSMPSSLSNNKKISATLFGRYVKPKGDKDSEWLSFKGNSIKEILR